MKVKRVFGRVSVRGLTQSAVDRNSLKSTRSNSLNKASDQPMVECP